MPAGIIGRKIGMTRIFTEGGECIPVTVLEAGPNSVLQKKTEEKEEAAEAVKAAASPLSALGGCPRKKSLKSKVL